MTEEEKIIEECLNYLREHSNPDLSVGYTHFEVKGAIKQAIQKSREETLKEVEERFNDKVFKYALEKGGDKLHLNQIIQDIIYEIKKEVEK